MSFQNLRVRRVNITIMRKKHIGIPTWLIPWKKSVKWNNKEFLHKILHKPGTAINFSICLECIIFEQGLDLFSWLKVVWFPRFSVFYVENSDALYIHFKNKIFPKPGGNWKHETNDGYVGYHIGYENDGLINEVAREFRYFYPHVDCFFVSSMRCRDWSVPGFIFPELNISHF